MTTTTTDPIADMLARIRNAILVRKVEIVLPYSKVKEAVARLLMDNKFIDKVETEEASVGRMLKLTINQPNSNARITAIERLSKPGRRLYTKADEIPVVKRGRGIVILSTSKGVMSGAQAKSQRLGGELICEVY